MAKNKIKLLMDQKGVTGYRLMKLTGLSYSIIHKLIEVEEIPEKTSWGTLKKIKEALGVESIEDLEEQED